MRGIPWAWLVAGGSDPHVLLPVLLATEQRSAILNGLKGFETQQLGFVVCLWR